MRIIFNESFTGNYWSPPRVVVAAEERPRYRTLFYGKDKSIYTAIPYVLHEIWIRHPKNKRDNYYYSHRVLFSFQSQNSLKFINDGWLSNINGRQNTFTPFLPNMDAAGHLCQGSSRVKPQEIPFGLDNSDQFVKLAVTRFWNSKFQLSQDHNIELYADALAECKNIDKDFISLLDLDGMTHEELKNIVQKCNVGVSL